jgi:transcriptional regulator with XRE-family HTH domain
MNMSTNIITSFGEMIRLLRLNKKLTQREVAVLLDIDTSILSKYERNKRQPTKEQIEKIADVFGTDIDALKFEIITDKIANQFVEEDIDSRTIRIAERKAEYIKLKKKIS